MDSILNVGVNDSVIQRLISITSNPKFAYDVQRRFLQQFGTVVLKISKDKYVKILDETKSREGVSRYTELSSQALQSIVHEFKQLGEIPSDPFEQLKMTVKAIFNSWSDTRYPTESQLVDICLGLKTFEICTTFLMILVLPLLFR